MIQRLIAEMARLAVERRGTILFLFLAVTVAFASLLPRLKVDTSPEALVSEIEGQDQAESLFEESFGRSETQIIVALQAPDILSKEALEFQFRAHHALRALAVVSGVDGLTHAPLPDRFKEDAQQPLPPQYEAARAAKMTEAIRAARREGSFPNEEVLEQIVAGDPNAYPGGVSALEARLLNAESAPAMTEAALSQVQYEALLAAIERADWLRPLLLSRDGTAAALIVHLNKEKAFDEKTRMAALDEVRKTLDGLQKPKLLSVEYGGSPVLGEAILDKLERDRLTLNPAMGLLCLLVLVITFRWAPAVVAPLLAVAVACVGVMGAMVLLDQPLTILTNIIPPLLLIVGLSDSVHLIGRYREEVGLTPDRMVAAKRATTAMVAACFLTSLTTAVGFGSMATAKTDELKRFGYAASFGVMLAYFATVFCVPAFISYFKVPRKWQSHPEARAQTSRLEIAIASVALFTMKHFKLVALFAVFSTAGLAYLTSRVQADARLLDAFDQDEEISVTTRTLEDKLGGIRPLEVLLSNPDGTVLEPKVLNELAKIENGLLKDPEVISVSSYIDPFRTMRSALSLGKVSAEESFHSSEQVDALSELLDIQRGDKKSSYLKADHSVARMTVFFRDSGVRHTLSVVRELEENLRDKFAAAKNIKVTLLGEAYTGSVGREHVLRDLLTGLGVALLTIFGLLTLLFRSLPLGLAAMPPNVIPLLATGAYMMARGIQLNLTTVITFSIGIGLAVDDTVHVVARFREEAARISSGRVALLRAVRGTGTSIFITSVSLALGFGVLMLSAFVSVRQFGELIAITVVNCLFGAMVVQPAMLRIVTAKPKTRAGVATRKS